MIKVALFYGGRSVEHQIAIISALQAARAINLSKYSLMLCYFDEENNLYTGDALLDINNYQTKRGFVPAGVVLKEGKPYLSFSKKLTPIDVALPIVHGQGVEDGSLVGFLNMYNIPALYSLTASALAQDKVLLKKAVEKDVPVVPYLATYQYQYEENPSQVLQQVADLGYPVIVKPASLGSSIGVGIAHSAGELKERLLSAFRYERKVLIETVITSLQEVNCAIAGYPGNYRLSLIEEVLRGGEFLSFTDKYEQSNQGMAGVRRQLPAQLSLNQERQIKEITTHIALTLGLSGVSRLDFLIDQDRGKVYFNELNTIPGSLSFYLYEEMGLLFDELIDFLIQCAAHEDADRKKRSSHFSSRALENIKGSGKLL